MVLGESGALWTQIPFIMLGRDKTHHGSRFFVATAARGSLPASTTHANTRGLEFPDQAMLSSGGTVERG
jgi:hypothetical protein